MRQSLTLLERGNPPPRRKSCAACIKAKRRCDLGRPSCLRCSQKRQDCRYPAMTVRKQRNTSEDVVYDSTTVPVTLDVPTSEPHPQLDAVREPALPFTPTGDDLLLANCNFDMLEFINTPEDALDDIFDPSADYNRRFSPVTWRRVEDHPCDDVIPAVPPLIFSPGTSDPTDAIDILISTRLQYAIEAIKAAPSELLHNLRTPWCHPTLYKHYMPPSMQDAFSSCALYVSKTAINTPIILRIIESRTRALVATPLPTSRLDLLARTHALLLYQIMRLFDGDIRARAAAEATIPSLEDAAAALLSHVHAHNQQEESPPMSPAGACRRFWEDWVFQESARRTELIVFLTLQTYRMLKGQRPLRCDDRTDICQIWTLSAHLWGATDAVDFAVAWKTKRHVLVTSATSVHEEIRDAKADDFDEFGKIFLTSLLGIEDAKCWLLLRGGYTLTSSW